MLATIITSEVSYLVQRGNLFFCLCPVCANELNWRHDDASDFMHASCCCHAFRAIPANSKMGVYRVDCKPVNMTNVYFLPRKTRLTNGSA